MPSSSAAGCFPPGYRSTGGLSGVLHFIAALPGGVVFDLRCGSLPPVFRADEHASLTSWALLPPDAAGCTHARYKPVAKHLHDTGRNNDQIEGAMKDDTGIEVFLNNSFGASVFLKKGLRGG